MCNPGCRLCECTEAEAEIVLQLKNELREKELKLTDIRLEALSSAHHLDQIREAMNRMQVRSHTVQGCVHVCLTQVNLQQHAELLICQQIILANLNSKMASVLLVLKDSVVQFISANEVCFSLEALEHDSYQLGG